MRYQVVAICNENIIKLGEFAKSSLEKLVEETLENEDIQYVRIGRAE